MAISAHGTLFQIGDGGTPEVFTTVAKVLDIEASGSMYDVETFYGDGGGFPAVVPGNMEPGDITFEVNYVGAESQRTLHDAHTSQAVSSFQIVFPTSPEETVTFTGYVTEFEFMAPVEGIMRAHIIVATASAMVISES